MASGDTALWLHNKLGSTDDLWSGKTICAQLTQERLQNIQACFYTLQPHVKVKLMLSFLHIPRRNVEQWKGNLEEILMMAIHDTDQWVSMIGEILRTYPASGMLNLELEDNNSTFAEVLSDLKKLVKKSSDMRVLPMECQFLNKTALMAATGQQTQPVKHFALKRKPKSAILRADLLQKSSDMAHNKKNHMPNSCPIKSRSFAKKMDDTTPLRGIPNKTPPSSGFRSPNSRLDSTPLSSTPVTHRSGSVRKDVGIKLLDITEQPVGSKEAKRRRKLAEIEALEQQKKDKEAAATAAAEAAASYTPDYAAGLVSPAPHKLPTVVGGTVNAGLPTPSASYVPTASARLTSAGIGALGATALSSATQQARDNLQQQLQQQLDQSQIRTQTMTMPHPAGQSVPIVLSPMQYASVPPPAAPQPTLPQPLPPKKGLSLTREQMLEAQEMFKSSNKVTRPEKALILGFMAGSRENPCPQQGDILSIRLSETKELVAHDGVQKNMDVDTFFQMNYATGEWKRIKKYREAEAV